MKTAKSEDQWRRKLTDAQYKVLRQCCTEPPFSGKLLNNKKSGRYLCAACGNELFASDKKFDSKSGWPSFWDVLDRSNVELVEDTRLGMVRTEVKCGKCKSHLGHVFDDGPEPMGKRYCINSIAMKFSKS